jgi:asparagine synthase (glutamine-hydrolysing)
LVDGNQPFSDENAKYSVVANGEVYNYEQIREEMLSSGHKLRTRSDIEVIPHVLEESGVAGIGRLRGMFAIAAFDRSRGRLSLARDHVGEKPLYTLELDDALWFSSELRPLLKCGVVRPELSAELVESYLLHGFIPETECSIAGIRQVSPGTVWTYSLKDLSRREDVFWAPNWFIGSAEVSRDDIVQGVLDAVIATCAADVPIGVALSGGVDSTLVAAVASRVRPDLRTFTIGYDHASTTDESVAAATTAAKLSLPIERIILRTEEVARTYGLVCAVRDEPIADIAGPAYAALANAFVASGTPVMLSGQGGDELFWGYPWVRQAAQMVEENRPIALVAPRAYLRDSISSAGAFSNALRSLGGIRTYTTMRRLSTEKDSGTNVPLYPASPSFRRIQRRASTLLGRQPKDPTIFVPGVTASSAVGFMSAMLSTYLRSNGLTQLDRLSMAASVESRTPFVDRCLMELVLSGQGNSKMRVLGKGALRDALKSVAPNMDHLGMKRGFTPPVRSWLSGIWRVENFSHSHLALAETGLLNVKILRDELSSPFLPFGEVNSLAFRLATLELWWRSID